MGGMPFIPDEEIEKVRQASDIVLVIGEKLPLKKAGRLFKALCPFHTEKTPSFIVNPERQIFHCFGCQEGGNVFTFLMKHDGLEFPEIVERLAERFGIVLSRRASSPEAGFQKKSERDLFFRINQLAARHFHENLLDPEKGGKGRAYLEERKIRPEIYRRYPLGYALGTGRGLLNLLREKNVPLDKAISLGLLRRGEPETFDFFRDRLIFPVVSSDGKILGFSGRALESEQQPKYLNSPDSPLYSKGDSLLGFHLAKESIRAQGSVVIVEGNFDQLRLYQEGVPTTVAPLGTALTERQIRFLSRFADRFVVLFDGDSAGERASERALETFLPLGLMPQGVTLPAGEDPDSFVLKRGVEELQHKIRTAPYLLDLFIEKGLESAGSDPVAIGGAVERISEKLRLIAGDVEKSLYIQRVTELTGLPSAVVSAQLRGQNKKRSNFSKVSGEEKQRVSVVEKTLFEILLSGRIPPETFFAEIAAADFTEPFLSELWERVRSDFEKNRSLEVGRMLNADLSPALRRFLSGLTVDAEKWENSSSQVAEDCLRRFRVGRMKGILQKISHEIRDAERQRDPGRVQELLEKKTAILKEMTHFGHR